MELTREVKELVLANNIDYVGVAPVERFKYAPKGHKPTDLLPGARSVVSIGIRMVRGSILTQRRALANPELRHISLCYRWGSYGMLNRHFLDPAALKLARFLERSGYIAVPQVSSGVDNMSDVVTSASPLSQKHAAVAAGLGEFGWNTLCLTPDVGPRVRFASVITTAELEPDPMYDGPSLCDLEKCMELGGGVPVCMRVCPIQSFNPTKRRTVIIGDKEFKYGVSNYFACAIVGAGLRRDFLGLTSKSVGPDDIATWEADYDADIKAIRKINFSGLVQQIKEDQVPYQRAESWVFGRSHYCANCMFRCPVGAPAAIEEIMKREGVENTYGAKPKN